MALPLVSSTTDIFLTIACCLLCVIVAIYHWNRRELYIFSWKCKGPIALPIIGNALDWLGSPSEMSNALQRILVDFPTSIRFWFGPVLCFIPRTPEEYSNILNNPNCLKKSIMYDKLAESMGDGLITASGERWKIHRKLINPAFNQKILDSYVSVFMEHAAILRDKFKENVGKGVFDAFKPFLLFTMDSLCETAMNLKISGYEIDGNYYNYMERLRQIFSSRAFQFWKRPDFIFNRMPESKEYYDLLKKTYVMTRSVLQIKRRDMKIWKETKALEFDDTGKYKKCFLEHLLQIAEERSDFSEEDVIAEINTFMAAGSETTAATLSLTCIMLGMRPDIQEKIFAELNDVFGDSDRPATYEDVPKLEYLERVLKEALRLFPSPMLIGRRTTGNVVLDDIIIPPGVTILLPILNLHRDPKIWSNPLEFNPDRFLSEEVRKRHPYSYLPFSGGPRTCIGYKFSMMTMKVVMSTLLRTFKIKTNYRRIEDIRFGMIITTIALDGHNIELEFR